MFPGLGSVPSTLGDCSGGDFGSSLVLEILLGHLVSLECVQTFSGSVWSPASLQPSHGSLPVNELFLALNVLNLLPVILDLASGFAEDFFQLVHLRNNCV